MRMEHSKLYRLNMDLHYSRRSIKLLIQSKIWLVWLHWPGEVSQSERRKMFYSGFCDSLGAARGQGPRWQWHSLSDSLWVYVISSKVSRYPPSASPPAAFQDNRNTRHTDWVYIYPLPTETYTHHTIGRPGLFTSHPAYREQEVCRSRWRQRESLNVFADYSLDRNIHAEWPPALMLRNDTLLLTTWTTLLQETESVARRQWHCGLARALFLMSGRERERER